MRRATETSMGSAPRAAALRSLATTRHDALSPQYAGKCCSISSRTSASVRSCITSGMTSGRGSGRDQFGLGRGHSYATQTPAWPENRHDRPSGRATDQRFRPIPSSFKRVRCALGPATARPAPPSAQQRPALGDAPDPPVLTAARGAIAAGLAKQEVCVPAEAINLGDDDLSAVSATRYRSKRVTRTLLVKGSIGTAGKEHLLPANAVKVGEHLRAMAGARL